MKVVRQRLSVMLFSVLIIFTGMLMLSGKNPEDSNVISLTKSSLILNIKVNTNIDCFTCEYESNLTDTIALTKDDIKNMLLFEGIHLAIPVNVINCHNIIMNSDLQDLLKAEDHPHILVDLSNFIINKISNGSSLAEIMLSINGTTKKYSIEITNYYKNNRLYFYGGFPVNLNDFYINPPSKLFGMVKVDETIGVNFSLAFNMN